MKAEAIPRDESAERYLPAYDLTEFRPVGQRYCAAVFAINEGERVVRQLETMQELTSRVDILFADGGSTDGSTEPERLAALGLTALLVKREAGALGTQMLMAFAYALDRGYAGVITIDGNGKDDPDAIPRFVDALENGSDHVQGSRFIAGGHHENTPLLRLLGVRLLHAPLISLAARTCYTDTTNGFRAYSRRLLSDPRVAPFRKIFSGYELHYYLAIRAARLGFKVEEIPVTRTYPNHGPTPTKISPIRGNLRVLGCLLAACTGRYDPPREAA